VIDRKNDLYYFFETKYDKHLWCVDSGMETPGPISNPAVKHSNVEGSARETECENRKMHLLLYLKPFSRRRAFFLSENCYRLNFFYFFTLF
jgi:hypothetical protein